ncbi:putative histone-lysine N-methyltransferase PRDM6 isoform X1 [Branchiostoma floridae]|uniref:Histone-lysine N-methyltransferase PRDM6 isoform X1 n=2 Tax=Branchiostoma floridae TaxID=7739 RepID=A0A9J7MGG3_BRAFL|nr:putative histone-lysine N-methyltransferase PRDM6 isoform X1 [Branchiostoma floridae]
MTRTRTGESTMMQVHRPDVVLLARTYSFTPEDVDFYLYGRNPVRTVQLPGLKRKPQDPQWCDLCKEDHQGECPVHGPLHSLRRMVSGAPTDQKQHCQQYPYAVTSLPDEVTLCHSSIPGEGYGICATRTIPVGTWIGPYEGVRMRSGEIPCAVKTTHFWEMYDNGMFNHYIDGTDVRRASWMRYIRCARHRAEQNMVATQYKGCIFYKIFREIKTGEELLVWYDPDSYIQFMGVPLGRRIKDEDITAPPSVTMVLQKSGSQSSSEMEADKIETDSSDTASLNGHTASSQNRSSRYSSFRTNPPKHTGIFSARPSRQRRPNNTVTQSSPDQAEVLGQRDAQGTSQLSSAGRNSDFSDWNLWKCGQCFKTFTQRVLLQMHVCSRNPDRPYQCGHCTQAFSQPIDLRNHVVTHSSDRPFKCGYCGRAFAGATTLNNHIRTHTGERPFRCGKCKRRFSQATQLSRHQRTSGDCQQEPGNETETDEQSEASA